MKKGILIGIILVIILAVTSMSINCAGENTQQNSNTSSSKIWSHTGYVKTDGTGGDTTTIIFQDGFSVSFAGALRYDLLPSIGEKIEIKYGYDASLGKNNLISLERVP